MRNVKKIIIAILSAVLIIETGVWGFNRAAKEENYFPVTATTYDVANSTYAIQQAATQANLNIALSVFNQTNAVRTHGGLQPLQWDAELFMGVAIRVGELPFKFSHTRPSGKQWYTACSRMYGENLAQGYKDATTMMVAWCNSPSHAANIINRGFKKMGVAVIYYGGKMYCVQAFGY